MKRNIMIFAITAVLAAGLHSFSYAQKKDETKPGAHTMPNQMSEKMKDMSKMMAEMQEEMKNIDKMMEDTHKGMSNEDMAKMHERMTQMHEQMKQMRQQLSDMHHQMMKGGEGGMMGRGTMGHDPSTRGGHMGGTGHGNSRGEMDMMKQKR